MKMTTPREDGDRGQDNARRAAGATDAAGRRLEVIELDRRSLGGISRTNCCLPNDGVVVPVAGSGEEEAAVDQVGAAFPGAGGGLGARTDAARGRRAALHHPAGPSRDAGPVSCR